MAQRPVVIVASADAATRSHVRLTLGSERFEVHDAHDTDAAIAGVAQHLPRLLVLDLDLPGSGALALAHTARSHAATSAVTTLLLVPRGRQIPENGGVDAALSVPTTSFALLRKVDELLGAD